ncbi:hypothetical protein VE04_04807 [Pseudogymnoascus sp. 24MN13]|nr:hypothetical protein VE04_04807 [Pseudogymnoascus sp. 24MN13]
MAGRFRLIQCPDVQLIPQNLLQEVQHGGVNATSHSLNRVRAVCSLLELSLLELHLGPWQHVQRGKLNGVEPRCGTESPQVETAFTSGLPEDISSIDCNPVRSKLAPKSQLKYDNEYVLWEAYKRKLPEADPRTMQCMKHFSEVVGRSTVGRLDEGRMPTVKTVRNKVRIFMSQWERVNHQSIPPDVHNSMALYIKHYLRHKIPLLNEEKAPTFLTIQNYLEMEELLWQGDYHNYIHEGSRVDLSTLLKMHCYTSARLQEICQAKYKDLVCIVAWKDGEPEIKLSFKREKCKNMEETPKK